jgi:mono/diheme cytochrome c family protein
MRESTFQARFVLLSTLVALTAACPSGDDGESGGEGTEAGSTSAADSSSGTADPTAAVDSSGGEASSTGNEPEPVSGEEFFLSVCAPCHGQDGEGTMLGYALQHPVRDYTTWVVRNGRPPGNPELPGSVMVAYSTETLDEATLEEIWDYLDAFPQPTTGEALYLDYCRNCHGEDAAGGITGIDLREFDDGFAEFRDQVREGDNMSDYSVRTEAMPAFDESRLSDAEIQLIADHVASL